MGGGGGGGFQQPQVIYRDNPNNPASAPVAPLPAPLPPTPMNDGVAPISEDQPEKVSNTMGTSMFKINRDPMVNNDYEDQGLDSGISYLG